ncbi:MAG: hypothetical protein AB7L66_01575 [Gemmatimonadales bacterium]
MSDPAGAVEIRGPEPLAGRVRAWLSEGRLASPRDSAIDVIEAPAEPNQLATPDHHRDGVRVWVARGPNDPIRLHWDDWHTAAEIRPDGTARLTIAPPVAADIEHHAPWILVTAIALLFRRGGLFHLHAAAAVGPGETGWVLVGNSASGKSTTAALMARRGWHVATDDIAFLQRDSRFGVVVRGFRSRLALRAGGHALLGAEGGTPLGRREKIGYWAEELGGAWRASVAPDYLVFPEVRGDRTTFEPIRRGEAIRGLFDRSFWPLIDPAGTEEQLALLKDLAARAQCFRASLAPDLFEAPGLLADFVPQAS